MEASCKILVLEILCSLERHFITTIFLLKEEKLILVIKKKKKIVLHGPLKFFFLSKGSVS